MSRTRLYERGHRLGRLVGVTLQVDADEFLRRHRAAVERHPFNVPDGHLTGLPHQLEVVAALGIGEGDLVRAALTTLFRLASTWALR